jgi:hypothetical protein
MLVPKKLLPTFIELLDGTITSACEWPGDMSPEDIEVLRQVRDKAALCYDGGGMALRIEIDY